MEPTSKELYMMNGGKKMYIYTDGFGDIYKATPEEEEEWSKEVVEKELKTLDTEENSVNLRFAIDNLVYHGYKNLEPLLIQKLESSGIKRQIVLAASLWKNFKYPKSYSIIEEIFYQHRKECLDTVFTELEEFRKHPLAAKFLVGCLEEKDDDELIRKARVTLVMWSYSGMAYLREGDILEQLKAENKGTESFKVALKELKERLFEKKG